MVGKSLGHYEIIEPLGSGGMGDVYRAHDSSLNRDVAVKVLPEDLADDPDRLARFEREAAALAALDHPNIVTVFSVEEATTDDGARRHFITMQLVEGKTLSELIPRNGLSVERFFALAIPLADAISAAHEQSIVHRDLKPANIMVSDDGRVRVLDFGLAKLREEEAGREAKSALPTAAATKPEGLTDEGVILGTVAYMSPEQAEGKPVDHRTDVFSLGIILYEMATGERPFKGDTKVSVMSSILRESPTSVTELNRNAPRHLARIIKHGLEKDISRRFQSARDLKNELEELAAEVESGEVVPAGVAVGSTRPRVGIGTIVGVAAIVVIAVAAFAIWTSQTGLGEDARGWQTTALTRLPGVERYPSISPDGDEFLYVDDTSGNADIYLQKIGGSTPMNLTRNSPESDSRPAFSPDGLRIAFWSNRGPAGIWVMGPTGESPRFLVAGNNPAWSPDGRQIVYGSVAVGNPRSLTPGVAGPRILIVDVESVEGSSEGSELAEGYHPSWSPGGGRIAYLNHIDGVRDIWTIPAEGGEPLRVTDDAFLDWNPVWAPDGGSLYFASNRGGADNIWQIAIDEATGVPKGDPTPVTSGGSDLQGFMSVSRDGNRIIYMSDTSRRNLQKIDFDPIAKTTVGEPVWITNGPRDVSFYDVSPDGEWIVFTEARPQEDLFRIGTDGTDESRITDDLYHERRPRFSPNGARIALYYNREHGTQIWTMGVNGTGATRLTEIESTGGVWHPSWSPEGDRLVVFVSPYDGDPPGGAYIIDATVTAAEQKPIFLPLDDGRGVQPMSWSLDGRYISGNRDRGTIYVYSFATERWRRQDTDLDGWVVPGMWMPDNQHLNFSYGGGIWLVDSQTGTTKEIFSDAPDSISGGMFSRDGRTLFFARTERGADIHLLTREPVGR